VHEWRNKVEIAQHRKDFNLKVESNCNIPEARLNASYVTCNGFDLTFSNESTNGGDIRSYYWDFGDPNSGADTSDSPVAAYTFPTAGTYTVTLITNKGGECSDTAITEANVYPGFVANFTVSGSCLQNGFTFKDASTTEYGVVNSWSWNFGDPATLADTSHVQTPEPYLYSQTGTVTAQLIVGNSKGCLDTLAREVVILDRPVVTVPFRDTLICRKDDLQLSATTDVPATYSWTPLGDITNANTANPIVSPGVSTTYYVTVDAGGNCLNMDSIRVNVIDKVTLSLGNDTTICLTDAVQLQPVTNGLSFTWSPAETLSSDTAKNTFATPAATTTYRLNARVGGCAANDAITIYTAPYPEASVSPAVPICYGTTAQLSAMHSGNEFTWAPAGSLLQANTLTPTAAPFQTTVYTFTTRNTTAGSCPKPVSDTVRVVVVPPVRVFAGNDTNIVVGQTLQLQATGALNYTWSPPTYLNNMAVSNPEVTMAASATNITYMVKGTTAEGCSDVDSITVYQYKTLPEIFIPSAFTPNNDGLDDMLRPIIAGMKKFENFSVYNRWGQLLYTTSVPGQGWNGLYRGVPQPEGTYIYIATATDYLDKPVVRRGTVVLIR
jgi:gliding motility-associated-like protein